MKNFFKKISRVKKGTIIFAAVILSAVAASVWNGKFFLPQKGKKSEFKKIEKNSFPLNSAGKKKFAPKNFYIAKIVVEGAISSATDLYDQEWILSTIDEIKNDEKNCGIILYVDSPGGSVYETDEVYLALMDYKKETKRPVYSYFAGEAASGGYYLGCAGDFIMANRNSLTGCIGVIFGQLNDFTELMEKIGIKSVPIHSGRNKLMGGVLEPITDEQKKIMQDISDECYEQFVDIVQEARGLPREKIYELADGRIYTAKQAKENGLIDAIGSLDDLVDAMDRKEFDFADYDVEEFRFQKEYTFWEELIGAAQKIENSLSANGTIPPVLQKALEPKIKYPAYYWQNLNSQ